MAAELLSHLKVTARSGGAMLRTPVGGYLLATAVSLSIWASLLRSFN